MTSGEPRTGTFPGGNGVAFVEVSVHMPSPSHRTLALSRRAAIRTGAAGLAATHVAMTGIRTANASQSATPAPAPAGITPGGVAQAVDALDAIVSDAQETSGVPGVSVAVVYHDDVIAARGYGIASTATGDPVDADTVFQLASLSKPIASTVVASIVGDKVATWDSKIIDHLPAFAMYEPWVTSQVTIRDMFTHRSGLPEHAGDLLEDMGYDRDEVLHRLRYLRPETSFRSTYKYTNFGLTAGAVSAAMAVDSTWEDVSDARLYEPAGMTRTSSRFDDFINRVNHASGHVLIDDAWTPEYVRNADAQSPAGGVSSSASDMARWIRLQLANGQLDGAQIVPADALGETHLPQIVSDQADDPAVDRAGFYGLGWNVNYADDGSVRLGHSGAFSLGAGTTVMLLPAAGFGIVVLTNGAPIGLAEAVTYSFLDVVRTGAVQNDYLAIFAPIFAELTALDYGNDVDYSTPPAQPSPAQDATAYTGVYTNSLYGPIEITDDGGELTISMGPAPDSYPLTHWDRDTFLYLPIGENANALSAVTFTIGAGGAASHVVIENLDVNDQGTFSRDDEPSES